MVQDFRNTLIREGRSRVMAKKVIGSLGAILASAMAAGRVGRNVVRDQERHSRRQNRLDKRHERRIEVGVDVLTRWRRRSWRPDQPPLNYRGSRPPGRLQPA